MFNPEQLPRQLADALDMVACFPVEKFNEMTPDERATWVAGLERLVNSAKAVSTQALGSFDAAGDGHTLHAARSTTAWARGALSITGGEATERVHLARSARTFLAPSMRLLSEGALSYEQVRSIERGVRTCLSSTANTPSRY